MDTIHADYAPAQRDALVMALLTDTEIALPASIAGNPIGNVIIGLGEDSETPMSGFPVWVLTVVHEYGENVEVYTSEAAAKAGLLSFVAEWWEDTMGDEEMPEDDDAAISAYFEVAGNNGEGCTITETTINI